MTPELLLSKIKEKFPELADDLTHRREMTPHIFAPRYSFYLGETFIFDYPHDMIAYWSDFLPEEEIMEVVTNEINRVLESQRDNK